MESCDDLRDQLAAAKSFADSLADKVREQAGHLQAQAQELMREARYRALCEKRLLELDPTQRLPLNECDLGRPGGAPLPPMSPLRPAAQSTQEGRYRVELRDQGQRLEKLESSYRAACDRLSEYNKAVRELRANVESKDKELQAYMSKCARLQSALDDHAKRSKEADDYAAQLEHTLVNEARQGRRAPFSPGKPAKRVAFAGVPERDERSGSLRRSSDQWLGGSSARGADADFHDQEKSMLLDYVEESLGKVEALTKENSDLRLAVESAKAEAQEAQEAAEQSRKDKEASQATAAQLEKTVSELREKVAAAETAVSEAQRQAAQRESELTSLREQLSQASRNDAENKAACEALKSKLVDAQQDGSSLRTENTNLRQYLHRLKNEYTTTMDEIEGKLNDFVRLHADCEQLRLRCTELERRVTALLASEETLRSEVSVLRRRAAALTSAAAARPPPPPRPSTQQCDVQRWVQQRIQQERSRHADEAKARKAPRARRPVSARPVTPMTDGSDSPVLGEEPAYEHEKEQLRMSLELSQHLEELTQGRLKLEQQKRVLHQRAASAASTRLYATMVSLLSVALIASSGRGTTRARPVAPGASPEGRQRRTRGGFAVVGYVPEWRTAGLDWDGACAGATHLLLFSVEVAADSSLAALDRRAAESLSGTRHGDISYPSEEVMAKARAAADRHGTALMLCVGGNSRSGALPQVAVDGARRAALVRSLVDFCEREGLDGVDMNWEYPNGQAQWQGLFALLEELHAELSLKGKVVTMALYPGQERLLAGTGVERYVDLIHMMAYDNVHRGGGMHSTMQFAKEVVKGIEACGVDPAKFTLGLPFYARHTTTGDWKTYADLQREHGPLDAKANLVADYYFNGPDLLRKKTAMAMRHKLGGVMIWEMGQDVAFGSDSSLLKAVWEEVRAEGAEGTAKAEL
eukprot:m51a1_g4439 putative chitinase (926) ;mRNA; r:105031-109724